jgi:hypothetical protein
MSKLPDRSATLSAVFLAHGETAQFFADVLIEAEKEKKERSSQEDGSMKSVICLSAVAVYKPQK